MKNNSMILSYADAIRLALEERMDEEAKTLVYGLGVDDAKAMYGTLLDFQ